MTPKTKDKADMCVSEEVAQDLLADGEGAMDYLETELGRLAAEGMPQPEIEARVKATKKKLTAIRRKWDL